MSAYVDAMVKGKRIGRAGPLWCHLLADTPWELHAMADRIGLLRSWFQPSPPASTPHYDIGSDRIRGLALQAGAIECDRNTFVGHMRRIRALVAADPAAWDARAA